MSLPTVSAPWAMAECPDARAAERDALLELIAPRAGDVVIDLQAAGGYLADGIHARFGADVRVICVEPGELRHRIAAVHRVCADPVHALASIADASVDAVAGLAGLHHSEDQRATAAECLRVLRPGGVFAVCDVTEGSAESRWLNGYVAAHCAGGHAGNFPPPGGIAALLREAGFEAVREDCLNVPWRFADEARMGRFFAGLFGLDRPAATVAAAVRERLPVRTTPGGLEVDWHLAYARGLRPAR